VGVPSLRWFGLYRLLETGALRTNIVETSLLRPRSDATQVLDLTVLLLDRAQVKAQSPLGPQFAPLYPFVEVFGCRSDISVVKAALVPQYEEVVRGVGYAIFRVGPGAAH